MKNSCNHNYNHTHSFFGKDFLIPAIILVILIEFNCFVFSIENFQPSSYQQSYKPCRHSNSYISPCRHSNSSKTNKNRKKIEIKVLAILGLAKSFKTMNQPGPTSSDRTALDGIFIGKY